MAWSKTFTKRDDEIYIESGGWKCSTAPAKIFYVEQLPNGEWVVFEGYDEQ